MVGGIKCTISNAQAILIEPLVSIVTTLSYDNQIAENDGVFFFSTANQYHETFDSAWGSAPNGLLWVPDIRSPRFQRPALQRKIRHHNYG